MTPWQIKILGEREYEVFCLLPEGGSRTFTLEFEGNSGTLPLNGGVDEMMQVDQVQAIFVLRTVQALHSARQSEKLLKTA